MVAPIKVIILKETLHKANLFLEGPKEVAVTFDVVIACQSQQQLWGQIASLYGENHGSFKRSNEVKRRLTFDLDLIWWLQLRL